MKWIAREKAKVDRVACPWLINKLIHPQAEFLFVAGFKFGGNGHREGQTLAGFVVIAVGRIPQQSHVFEALDMGRNRVDKVMVVVQKQL